MARSPKDIDPKIQARKFRETARALECDESEERFNAVLGKVVRSVGQTEPNKDDAGKKSSRSEKP
jgi:hypothetical protein